MRTILILERTKKRGEEGRDKFTWEEGTACIATHTW